MRSRKSRKAWNNLMYITPYTCSYNAPHLRWLPFNVTVLAAGWLGIYGRRATRRTRSQGALIMPAEISNEALDFLLARAGLDLTAAQKAELKTVYAGIAQMQEGVRQPRGRMAELAHVYNFTAAGLGDALPVQPPARPSPTR